MSRFLVGISIFDILLWLEQAHYIYSAIVLLEKGEWKEKASVTTTQQIENQMRQYAKNFLRAQYGNQATDLDFEITAVDAYDDGGISEACGSHITIAAKRDLNAHKLTATTKLIIRHELGHLLDRPLDTYLEFEEEIHREKTAWQNAKLQTAAEHWYKNLSIRTHIDPLKMQAKGFPRPEHKISAPQLRRGTAAEVNRMGKDSVFVDETLAERFAMANLLENPDYYNQ